MKNHTKLLLVTITVSSLYIASDITNDELPVLESVKQTFCEAFDCTVEVTRHWCNGSFQPGACDE